VVARSLSLASRRKVDRVVASGHLLRQFKAMRSKGEHALLYNLLLAFSIHRSLFQP
jgi:hypothetical protein